MGAFTSSDPLGNRCARLVRSQPSRLALAAASEPSWRALVENATDVVYNQGSHLHAFVRSLKRCYQNSSVPQAQGVATRDALRFYARQVSSAWPLLVVTVRY